jgi:predicted nucleic acid-binding protein
VGSTGARPLIFDAGALIALERRDPRVIQLVQEARARGRGIVIPASVLSQVWRGGRDRQAPVALLLARKQRQQVEVGPLDEPEAKAVGLLCAAAGHQDIADGHVAYLSLLHDRAPVITSDPEAIARFSAVIPIVPI